MIIPVRANHKVFWAVVQTILIDVMNLRFNGKWMTERLFCDQYMSAAFLAVFDDDVVSPDAD